MLGALPGVSLRYLFGLFFNTPNWFPLGTFIVNSVGTFILGIIITMYRIGVLNSSHITGFGIGFCGSLTTMSTFAWESLVLLDVSIVLFFLYVVVTMIGVFLGGYAGSILVLYLYVGRVR